MQQYSNFMELMNAPEVVRLAISAVIPDKQMPFEEYFGGNIFVAENFVDLNQIVVNDEGGTAYDTVGQVETAHLYDVHAEEWVSLHTPTTDAGGAIYFVPKRLFTKALLETIRASV